MSLERVFGIHAVKTVLKYDTDRVQRLLVLKGREDKRITELLNDLTGIQVVRKDRRELDELAEGGVNQGIIAEVKPIEAKDERF